MYHYKVFGYIFRCEHEIKQLYAVPPTEHYDVEVCIGTMPDEILEDVAEITERPYMYWNEDYFWLANRYGILAVYKSGKIYAHNPEAKDILYLLQFVLGYGIAVYAHMHNRIAIHCGCVAIDGKAVILAGDSGSGKSTLTNELISRGATMLSDDVVAIGYDENHNPCVFPAFPQQKLCRDAAVQKGYNLDELLYIDPDKDKFAVIHTKQFSSEPHPLHTLLNLRRYTEAEESSMTDNIQTEAIDGFDKMKLLTRCFYLGPLVPNLGLSAEAFQMCVDLIKNCNVYRLKRSRTQNTLPEIVQFVYDTLGCMNPDHYMEVINSSLRNIAPSPEVISIISLEALYEFASLHKLIPLLVTIAEAWPCSFSHHKDLLNHWKSEAAGKVFLEYRKFALVKQLITSAKERNLPLIFFKGYILADLYPSFTMRTSSDTDLLVAPENFARACSLLEELQYIHLSHLDTHNVSTYVYREEGQTLHKIELHTSLFEDMQGRQIDYLNRLALAAPHKNIALASCGTTLVTLGHTEHLIYQLFHLVKHLCFHGLPIRYLLDIALFVQHYKEDIDWQRFNAAMGELGYACFWRHFVSLMEKYFPVPKGICSEEASYSDSRAQALLDDLLHFGMRSQENEISRAFYDFETYVENLEAPVGKRLASIAFDGSTVPADVVPLHLQAHPLLQKRIHLLQNLELI